MVYSQGDLSQKEKECRLLREQLKVVCESCEQVELRSSQEIADLEGKLQRHTEESQVNSLLRLLVGGGEACGERECLSASASSTALVATQGIPTLSPFSAACPSDIVSFSDVELLPTALRKGL